MAAPRHRTWARWSLQEAAQGWQFIIVFARLGVEHEPTEAFGKCGGFGATIEQRATSFNCR